MHLNGVESPNDPPPDAPVTEASEVVLRMPPELLRWASVALREARRRAYEEMTADRA